MRELIISGNDAGQRLDKYLNKYLKEAPSSFIYKMLRKKNIVLNQKKSDGRDIIKEGDVIKLFLADETIDKFIDPALNVLSSQDKNSDIVTAHKKAYGNILSDGLYKKMPPIVYEDDNLLIADKPVGLLSQQDQPGSISFNEIAINYLLNKGEIDEISLRSFKPSIVNRLDRNTSGLIIFAKNYKTAKALSQIIKDRSIHKYYRCIVYGDLAREMLLKAELKKDSRTNKVKVTAADALKADIYTKIYPIRKTVLDDKSQGASNKLTEVEVLLITGKTHQIRAHLASVNLPLIGDYKYGNNNINNIYKKKFGIMSQLLCAYKLEMPQMSGDFEYLSNKVFTIERPEIFERVMRDGNLEIKRS